MPPPTVKVLNVAEKPSVAKEITRLLGGNNVRRVGGKKYTSVLSHKCNTGQRSKVAPLVPHLRG